LIRISLFKALYIKYLRRTIIFFNKSDIFDSIYQKHSFSKYFPDYKGDDNSKTEIIEYLHKAFSQQQLLRSKIVYSHVTCATDILNIRRVFNDVQHIVINWSLERAGLV